MPLPVITFKKALANYLDRCSSEEKENSAELIGSLDFLSYNRNQETITVGYYDNNDIDVTIKIDYFYQRNGISCTCSNRYCLHGLASLVVLKNLHFYSYESLNDPYILDEFEIIDLDEEDYEATLPRRNNALKLITSETKEHKGFLFAGLTQLKDIRKWKYHSIADTIFLVLRSDNTLSKPLDVSHNVPNSNTPEIIFINAEIDGLIYVGMRCTSCKTKNQLCLHINNYLQNQTEFDLLKLCMETTLSYDSIVSECMSNFGISHEQFKEHFEVHLTPAGVQIATKTKDLSITASRLDTLIDTFREKRSRELNSFEKEIKSLRKSNLQHNALAWFQNNGFSYLSGTLNPGKQTLVSLRNTSEPLNLDAELFKHFNKFENGNLSIRDFHRGLVQQLHNLQNTYHYANISDRDYFYGNPKKKDLLEFKFHPRPASIVYKKRIEKGISYFDLSISTGDKQFSIKEIQWFNTFFFVIDGIGYLFESIDLSGTIKELEFPTSIPFLSKDDELIKSFEEYFQVIGIISLEDQNLPEIPHSKQIHISEKEGLIFFQPIIRMNDISYNLLDPESLSALPKSQHLIFTEVVLQLHPKFEVQYFENYYYLMVQDVLENEWFLKFFDQVQAHGIAVFGQEHLSSMKFNMNRAQVQMRLSSGIQWLEPIVDISFGKQTVKQKAWIDAVRKNEKYIKLDDGTLGILPEEWLSQMKAIVSVAEEAKGKLQISKLKFNVIENLLHLIDDDALKDEVLEKKERFKNFSQNQVYPIPKKLKAKLRPYQIQGFQWLMFLDEYDFGGILADDMGLGKTVQMIAFLLQQKADKRGTSLIIVPKSLVFNWSSEINKFAPSLTHIQYLGSNRQNLQNKLLSFDIVISTYDTIARDIDDLVKPVFNYIILDESQAIKNPTSLRYKACRLLRSRNKLAMTGTPVENNIFDLYAQFSFINPGFFGSQNSFKRKYATSKTHEVSSHELHNLQKMIHPFLLRRTKTQVATDLPDRTETIIYCEMDAAQRKMYDTLRDQIRMDLHSKGTHKKFDVLDGLLKLRLLCNAPELIDPTLSKENAASAKIDALMEQIDDLGNHKALVFSQFVKMLTIIRRELDDRGIKYAYLDGSTSDRQKAVQDFTNDPECNIFLISLKAGNMGLNLTKADYVYIIDPWWNPAVEAQAIDRTHRIGQDKSVFAYKLICKDTIEEKIINLQTIKKQLATDLIKVDESVLKKLSKDELMNLFDE